MTPDPYQKTAAFYDLLVEPMNAFIRKLSFEIYPPREGMHVLEVGCGTGTNLIFYNNAGCNTYGIDVSPSMLRFARSKLGNHASLHLGDASGMPYPDHFFDIVIAMFTLHEMPRYARLPVMKEMSRVIKNDGRLLITDFHPGPYRFPRGWFNHIFIVLCEFLAGHEHYRHYRSFMFHAGITPLLEHACFQVETKRIITGGNICLYLIKRL